MSNIKRLQSARKLGDVANILGIRPKVLSYVLYKKPLADKYSSFEIKKRDGSARKISAPAPDLSLIQSRLSGILQECMEEITDRRRIFNPKKRDVVSHGFVKSKSILTNARQHRNKKYVLNIDIKDFFGAINFGRIRGFFIKSNDFNFDPAVATVVAQIACFDGKLPQGSPCSPVVSNIVSSVLDSRLLKLAVKHGCSVTRYADDITFSTNRQGFPEELAVFDESTGLWAPGAQLLGVINRSGHEINARKTRMCVRGSRQEVTGLTVNKVINTRVGYRKNVRAMVHTLLRDGAFYINKKGADSRRMSASDEEPGSIEQLHGMLSFISSVDDYVYKYRAPDGSEKERPRGGESSRDDLFKRFLIYKDIYAAVRPTLIFEGDTDGVYITHAIRYFAASYPALAEVKPDGGVDIKIRRYSCNNTMSGRIINVGGGTGDLKGFMHGYSSHVSKIQAKTMINPVIVLVDNDAGCNAIASYVNSKRKGASFDCRREEFTHIFANLYLVMTPLTSLGQNTCIEDFFDKLTLAHVIDGKTFSADDKADKDLHYGKKVFAHRVIAQNASSIDFSGFSSILDRIQAAIDDFRIRFPAP